MYVDQNLAVNNSEVSCQQVMTILAYTFFFTVPYPCELVAYWLSQVEMLGLTWQGAETLCSHLAISLGTRPFILTDT